MAITPASLAKGQVGIVQTALYTSPGISFIKAVMFKSKNAATQTITVYFTEGFGASVELRQIVLEQNESYRLFGKDDAISMSPGDSIDAVTTTAAAVDFLVTGATL